MKWLHNLATACDTKEIAAVNKNALCKPRPYVVALEKPEGFVRVNNYPFEIKYHLKFMITLY